MTDHDPLCPATVGRYVRGTGLTDNECQCDLVARVRATEREQHESWAELVAKTDGAIRADLHTRVEALPVWVVERRTSPMAPKDRDVAVLLSDVLALINGGSDG